MEQHASHMAYLKSPHPDDLTFTNDVVDPSAFGIWHDSCPQSFMPGHVDWHAASNSPYVMPNQTYMTSCHSTPAFPSSSPAHHANVNLNQSPVYPSQLYTPTSLQLQASGSCNALMPANPNTISRPPSTDTQIQSSTSSISRPSSNASSPQSRAPKFKVPALKTQFEDQDRSYTLDTTPLADGFQVADSDSITRFSSEWLQFHDTSDQHIVHDTLSAVNMKASPGLLEPFQWQSPVTRRESISSAASGPVFSPFGTPSSAVWHPSMGGSPYMMQPAWIPRSTPGPTNMSPQSPNQARRATAYSMRRMPAQYLEALQRSGQFKSTSASLPSRKPRVGRNVSDSHIPSHTVSQPYSRGRSVDSRLRSRQEDSEQRSASLSQQLALPEFSPNTLFTSPEIVGTEFRDMSHMHTPSQIPLPSSANQTPMTTSQFTPAQYHSSTFATPSNESMSYIYQPPSHAPQPATTGSHPVSTPAHQPPLPVPSEPPLSDFLQDSSASACGTSSSHPPACGPIRQSPHFDGDIYTPRYKRRNAAGKWEGWCGYCQPGRWLDLKNSRYWEDKLRNHGICARTKTFFDGPTRIRWVTDRGTVWEGEPGDSTFDPAGRDGVEDDGVGRKREGLCSECNSWIPMDGMRSRGKGRCVAWWMHAYKCHEQSKSRTEGTSE